MKGPEEFTLNSDDRIRERIRRPNVFVHFTEDRHKKAETDLNKAIQASLDELLKANGDISYVQGVKAATETIARLLGASRIDLPGWTNEHLEVWLAHVVSTKAQCDCTIDTNYDGGYDLDWCSWYRDRANQRLWYLGYYGLTEEELIEREREYARQKAREQEARQEALRAERLRRLHELAAEFDVDPKYLP